MIERRHSYPFIFLTFLIAWMLDIFPLPGVLLWFRPDWTLLVLLVFVLMAPEKFFVGTAFFLGLILDLLQGSLLGEHALAMIVVVFLLVQFHRQIRLYPVLPQMMVMFLLLFLYRFLLYFLQSLLGLSPHTFLYWMPVLTSTLLWPWVMTILRR